MTAGDPAALARSIVARAKALGADLAGVAGVDDLKRSPSHVIGEQLPGFAYYGAGLIEGRKNGAVEWPDGALSAIVVAVAHPPEAPEMDWLDIVGAGRNTPGNRQLMTIASKLADWMESTHGMRCFQLPYHVIHGAIYMKDAAVLAGLGCIGKNNMLVTPRYGPYQRLRVVLTDTDLPGAGPIDFDPCEGCPMPCRKACPQEAFEDTVYTAGEFDAAALPGRDGVFSRLRCNVQMKAENDAAEALEADEQENPRQLVRFCRRCELACPVGRRHPH